MPCLRPHWKLILARQIRELRIPPVVESGLLRIPSKISLEFFRRRLADVDAEALCVRRISTPMTDAVLGVITREDIDNYRDVNQ